MNSASPPGFLREADEICVRQARPVFPAALLLLWAWILVPCIAQILAMPPGFAMPLKIATWNLDWLTTRPAGDPSLPADVRRRDPADFVRLGGYASRLDADIIGIQEVDGQEVAERLFPKTRWTVLLTQDPVVQRVGIAIRNGLQVVRNPDLAALNVYPPGAPHPLRSGLDVTVSDGAASLRILVVHLKTGCWDNPRGERQHSCPVLDRQFAVLDDWVLQRTDEGVPFLIMGDFNRRMTNGDDFYQSVAKTGPVLLATSGHASPCWGGEYFIDHVILGGAARSWIIPGSLRVMLYPGAAPDQAFHLSDHCPVSVRLAMP